MQRHATAVQGKTARRSKLADFVRDYRAKAGLTQAGLACLLGIESLQYVSKLETGRIVVPSKEFLGALATHTGQSVDQLLTLSRRSVAQPAGGPSWREDEASDRPVKLVFGHCLWGAPIFLAAHRGMIPQFLVASYALRDEPSRSAQPCWIVPDEVAVETPGPGATRAVPWSAVKILDMLEKEEIDLGAIPGNIIWGRGAYQRFMRIGTIVDSATGCTFVCKAGTFEVADSLLSTRDLFKLLLGYVERHDAEVRIAVEVGTVADTYLCRVLDPAEEILKLSQQNRGLIDAAERLSVDRVRWHCESSTLATMSFDALGELCADTEKANLLGVITWEPHASWLHAQDRSRDGVCSIRLHFSPDNRGQLTPVSFDLVMLRTSEIRPPLRLALIKLMQRLWQNATLLSELDGTSFNQEHLARVGEYFGFGARARRGRPLQQELDNVLRAIQNVRYCVHWAMETQALVAAMPAA